ncbi:MULTISPECIES: DUF1073 domain-containing protein [unclassified Novosphingobium]|uniref:DUF1073 domain-containing protein n=1 Tax=unclassified Novosphingobium TaxID=2644732 RepID=UPI001304D8F8|nr:MULTISPECIES: DUF1073 domain-containing protein [unclassified Novosphingobium]
MDRATADSFQNMQARLGVGAGNMSDANTYVLSNLLTRQPRTLEAMYRGSWVVGAVVDAVAEDMTREGVDFGSTMAPSAIERIHAAEDDLQIWQSLQEVIQWSRLYGGAIGVIDIDGQDVSTELNVDTIGQGQFLGITPLGRWELLPVTSDSMPLNGTVVGRPEFYKVGPQASAFQLQDIHHSRVIRMEGVKLPYFQRIAEAGWGMSVVERMYDRLVAYDSASQGSAQLIYKAYLRTLKIKGLRSILAAGGKAETAVEKHVEAIRKFQSSEGLTMLDSEDDFETHTYSFSGLNDLLLGFGQQLSGATQIPLVRLFGQSPAGLNSTGESDLRNYYDAIRAKQQKDLREPVNKVMSILYRSVIGSPPPQGFRATFNPLWQMSDTEKGQLAKTIVDAVGTASELGLISAPSAMRELKQSADQTGVFSNITDDEIKEAELAPPRPTELDPDAVAPAGDGPGQVIPAPGADGEGGEAVRQPTA